MVSVLLSGVIYVFRDILMVVLRLTGSVLVMVSRLALKIIELLTRQVETLQRVRQHVVGK